MAALGCKVLLAGALRWRIWEFAGICCVAFGGRGGAGGFATR